MAEGTREDARKLRRLRDVVHQGGDIFGECGDSSFCDTACRAWLLAFESLFHRYVARLAQFVKLDTKVAGRRSRLFTDVDEIRFVHPYENRHHGKPQLRVQKRVEFFEHRLLP